MRSPRTRIGSLAGAIALILLPIAAAAQPATPTTPALRTATSADTAAGKQVFDAQCAWCHGADGTGGTGPVLQRATLKHATTDRSLVEIVRGGIPGTEMPSFASALTERGAWQTAAYVRSLGRVAARPLPGDARRGAAVYESTGCASCHVVAGRGGVLGPELTAIGGLRGPTHLRDSLVTPAIAHPPGYLVVRAVTNNGAEIRGIRLGEDVFWVHIRDASGKVHVLEKSELSRLDRELDATLMPAYGSRLSATELDDLIAYLASLRGTT
jgi:cytochrome c oxidase cbb3-type subunit III